MLQPGAQVSSSVVLVDWLGQGGISQTSAAWWEALASVTSERTLVTRRGRELSRVVPDAVTGSSRLGPLPAHLAVLRAAKRTLAEVRPSLLVVQNFSVPAAERSLFALARRIGTRSVLVAHEPQVARSAGGANRGLAPLLSSADVVVAHTDHVAGKLARLSPGLSVTHVAHPVQVWLLAQQGSARPALEADGRLLALHFGHLHRGYKGTSQVMALGRRGVEGWRIAAVGKGAPSERDAGVDTVARFLAPEELVATVGSSDASLLPYRSCSQSGAVVLAQALGSVPVATAVGGILEQVRDGFDGLLLPPESGVERWAAALERLSDRAERSRMEANGRRRVEAAQRLFLESVAELAR